MKQRSNLPSVYRAVAMCVFLLSVARFFHGPDALHAQDAPPAQDTRESVDRARLDLAVPDNPANNILGLSQSDLLRPAGVRELGILLSSTIPGSVAFEAAPFLLFSTPTLQDYKARPFLYRIRISAATTEGSGGSRDLGAGIRFTILDRGDLRTNPELLDIYRQLGAITADMQFACFDENPDWEALDDEERRPLIAACVEAKLEAERLDSVLTIRRKEIKEEAWNKALCELGAALAAGARDSLYKNLIMRKYALWGTLAFPFLDTRGQCVAGFRMETFRGGDQRIGEFRGTAALRAYYGENDTKGFVNLDVRKESGTEVLYRGMMGLELGLLNGFWIEASLGVERGDASPARITTGLDLRFATPEIEE